MFDGGIQEAGLKLFSKHHVSEGIELLTEYLFTMKKHGSRPRLDKVLKMLKQYGVHAQRVIPKLEKVVDYYENHEEDYPKVFSRQKAETVRKAIAEIKKLTDKPKLIKLKR